MQPFLAEVEFERIIIFVVVAAIAFIQWIIKLIKDRAEAAENSRRALSPEQMEARRRVLSEQTRPVTPPPASPPQSGGMLEDLMGELRKAIEPAPERRAPHRSPPPPLPRPAVALPLAPRSSTPAIDPVPAATIMQLRANWKPNPLTVLLRTEGGYRQAFVLREILGPPRALHDYHGPD